MVEITVKYVLGGGGGGLTLSYIIVEGKPPPLCVATGDHSVVRVRLVTTSSCMPSI